MRMVSTNSLSAGTKLAKPIYNDNGQVLIQDGIPLTDRVINRLIDIGITFVYIEDELTKDIEINNIISDKVKYDSLKTIKEEFIHISDELRLKKSFNGDHLSKNFSKIIYSILEEIKENSDALSVLSDSYIYDSYIFTHSLNVTVYTLGLAMKLNFTEKKLLEIGLGAILHDVGKLAIPKEILNKPSALTDEEYEMMKTHAKEGFDLLKNLPNISLLTAHCALQHHERINGSGYPQKLIGEKIHPYAKIIGICDVFDAVTSNRVYRKAMLPHEGLELLYSGVGTLYDQEIIEAFKTTIAIYPEGLTVGLSDGRTGIVVRQNKAFPTRPIVRIIADKGNPLQPFDIDLMDYTNLTIVECEGI